MAKSFFAPVSAKVDFPKVDQKVLKFWNTQKIFAKSVKQNEGHKPFVFYEGPPTANGKPGLHHVLARSFKDLFPRYHNMKGEYSPRLGGWDTHGLPVEIEVEKKLGISGKKEIENLVKGDRQASIAKFNELCKKSVFEYVDLWKDLTERVGYWTDLDNAYITFSNDYIESCWAILKDFFLKGLLVRDYKVVPYCPRCGTPLSSHELSLGYDDVEDPSIYVRFRLKDREESLIVWTTTPWTLPGNVALAVDAQAEYLILKQGKEKLIVASEREEIVKDGQVIKKIKGKDLVGAKYEPLYNFYDYGERAYQVVAADFVSLEEGTGIVHTAVMYGEDDFKLGKSLGLAMHHLVNEEGKFTDEVDKWKGIFVKDADKDIIKDLDERGLLYRSEKIVHSYPLCWRCKTPLLYYAKESWFIKVTLLKKLILFENKKIKWIPKHMGTGRMGKWLEGMMDWALSRFRYWGTPLPIWKCEKCANHICIGSYGELASFIGRPLPKNFDPHRPFIDDFIVICPACGSNSYRYPEVIDVWFDSGAMPFSQWHYPYENKQKIDDGESFPADFIAEGQDQTRGWFYTLLAISTLYKGVAAYKNVISHNLVLDAKGKKMSKSVGNIIDPWMILDKYGADATRWYFYRGNVALPYLFDEKEMLEVSNRFFRILWNCYNFFVTYANIDGYTPDYKGVPVSNNILDKWIIARVKEVSVLVTETLDAYDCLESTQILEKFLDDVSRWFIRRSRERVGPTSSNDQDKKYCYRTLHFVLTTLSKMLGPCAPFISDEIYKNLTGEESVHLASWPIMKKVNAQEIEEIYQMNLVRKIVMQGHSERKRKGIPVRQPLAGMSLVSPEKPLPLEFQSLILEELNVKQISSWENKKQLRVNFDTKITPLLRQEALARELIRKIQGERKTQGINLSDYIKVTNPWVPDANLLLGVKRKTLAKEIKPGDFKVAKA